MLKKYLESMGDATPTLPQTDLGIATTLPASAYDYDEDWHSGLRGSVRIPHKKGGSHDTVVLSIETTDSEDEVETTEEAVELDDPIWLFEEDTPLLINDHIYAIQDAWDDMEGADSEVIYRNDGGGLNKDATGVFFVEADGFEIQDTDFEIGQDYSFRDIAEYLDSEDILLSEYTDVDTTEAYFPAYNIPQRDRAMYRLPEPDSEVECDDGGYGMVIAYQGFHAGVEALFTCYSIITIDKDQELDLDTEDPPIERVYFELIQVSGSPVIDRVIALCHDYVSNPDGTIWDMSFTVNGTMRTGQGENALAVMAAVQHMIFHFLDQAQAQGMLPSTIHCTATSEARAKVYRYLSIKIARAYGYEWEQEGNEFRLWEQPTIY